ncbi:MAG TPA: DUF1611 domain-containing protein [Planctomycetaceae bacterium]|jgi:uncharacterized NAD-dependent epimerase/dehydratase family protein|nr:hypothetical protein [Rhodopirellula sp.]MCH2361626.1 DUF1611 domain-containing protein [Pirellulales bacterium]HCK70989.1 DUF1611 domain-containing protein [Planctomycetaceae bacterium]|tara:strand:- start:2573 stop:3625 length:1053 start_codon:yes stop_codon:yes gene_type:complete
MDRKIVILTEGHSNPHTAKTGCCVIRYRGDEVLAVIDSTQEGKPVSSCLGVGEDLLFISSLSQAPQANTLLIGIAPPGGKVPESWRPIILEAIEKGMNVVSGLHDFISDDTEFADAASQQEVELIDVRKNNMTEIARRPGFREDCFRIHTVGHDCSVGKMVTSVEITNGLKDRGVDAQFLPTGQTGIMIEGIGYPMDRVIADFISGATEKLVLEQQHHDVLVIEGQGSIVHPSYSAVTLGILHGSFPHALVLCYEVLRDTITGLEHMNIPPLTKIRELNEMMGGVFQPCPVIAVSMNGRRVSAEEAEEEKRRVEGELGLPVCDVFRDGREKLVDVVDQFRLDWLKKKQDG